MKAMKRILPISYMRRMAALLVFLVALPAIIPAQTLKESANRLEQSAKALKKVADYPDQMAAWDFAKSRYIDSIGTRDSLKKIAKKSESALSIIKSRHDKIEKLASDLRPNAEQQAEVVLTRRYNANDVQQALQSLDPTTDIAMRLTQYETMTINLRETLDSANKVGVRRLYDSDARREEYLKNVFDKIKDELPSVLFNPEYYPYLNKVLNEVLEAKMEDTSLDLEEFIIDKL